MDVFQSIMVAMFARIPPASQLPFLSLPFLGGRPDIQAAVQVRALHIAGTFLQRASQVPHTSPALARSIVLFVPALVATLQSPLAAVRTAGLRCLGVVQAMGQV
jgi:hypothetical protein